MLNRRFVNELRSQLRLFQLLKKNRSKKKIFFKQIYLRVLAVSAVSEIGKMVSTSSNDKL